MCPIDPAFRPDLAFIRFVGSSRDRDPVLRIMISQEHHDLICHQPRIRIHPCGNGIIFAHVFLIQFQAIISKLYRFPGTSFFVGNFAIICFQSSHNRRSFFCLSFCALYTICEISFKIKGGFQLAFHTVLYVNLRLSCLGYFSERHRCCDHGISGFQRFDRSLLVNGSHLLILALICGLRSGFHCCFRDLHRDLFRSSLERINRLRCSDSFLLQNVFRCDGRIIKVDHFLFCQFTIVNFHIVYQTIELRIPVVHTYINILILSRKGRNTFSFSYSLSIQISCDTVIGACDCQTMPVGVNVKVSKAFPSQALIIAASVAPEFTICTSGRFRSCYSQPFLRAMISQE